MSEQEQPYTLAPSGARRVPVCSVCGMEPSSDAYAEWDIDNQKYVVSDMQSTTYCNTCDTDRVEEVEVYAPPQGLQELADYLRKGVIWYDAPFLGDTLDTTALPCFGGHIIRDPEVWSWDHSQVLTQSESDTFHLRYRTPAERHERPTDEQ